jgi:UDP-glucose 4-epimerase
MRILILGGSGFLGSHAVDRFLAGGNEVAVYDLSSERYRRKPPGVKYHTGDLGNVGALEEVISGGFDAVLHFISTTSPKSSNNSPEFDIQSNVINTVHMLDLCVKHKVRKVVFLSSGGTIYGNIGDAPSVNEQHPVHPLCSYAVSKLSIEHYLHIYKQLHGLDFVSVRVSNPFGERQNPEVALGAVTVFLHRAINRQPIEVWGDGSVVRDFIYAADVADAVYLATTKPISGVFNTGSGTGLSLRQLIAEIESVLNLTAQVHWMPGRPFDVPRIVLDSRKLQAATGWSCSRNFREGLTKTANWLTSLSDVVARDASATVRAVTHLDQQRRSRKP